MNDLSRMLADLDPWTFFGVPDPGPAWGPPSTKQAECLRRASVQVPKSKRQASALIGAMVARTQACLCTYRQALALLRMGHRLDLRALSFDEAQRRIQLAIDVQRDLWDDPPQAW